jgi:hypothetical protein
MPKKKSHRGIVRGKVTLKRNSANALLDHEESLKLIRNVAEALNYGSKVTVEPHWGRRGGQKNLHRIDVRSA